MQIVAYLQEQIVAASLPVTVASILTSSRLLRILFVALIALLSPHAPFVPNCTGSGAEVCLAALFSDRLNVLALRGQF